MSKGSRQRAAQVTDAELAANWELAFGARLKDWSDFERRVSAFNIPDGTGGVNPGDRRALFHLAEQHQPYFILEIGTHIGASTVHLAAHAPVVTVDIIETDWRKYGASHSPQDMVRALGQTVEFVRSASTDYLRTCENFDFIFLDGDHSKEAVMAEIPLALKKLNPGGVIVLHDYFPDGKPLWNTPAITGPYEAVKALGMRAKPLGALPWPTKLGSNVTSLAVLECAGS